MRILRHPVSVFREYISIRENTVKNGKKTYRIGKNSEEIGMLIFI